MVYGYHVIFGAYGFWLPNDPRGSWSDFVRTWELRRFGEATKVTPGVSVAANRHDVRARQAAKQALRYPPVKFSGTQARAVENGFGAYLDRSGVVIWACSIMPEHVHLVVARHSYKIESIVNHLKGAATSKLLEDELHPHAGLEKPNGKIPGCWARGEWKVYLDSVADIHRAIRYVENNPLKESKPRQRWKFVTPFSREPKATEPPAAWSPPAPR